MKFSFPVMAMAMMVSAPPQLGAQTASARLGDCLVQSSTGGQRLALAQWIAHAIISHPNVRQSIAAPQEVLDDADRRMAGVFTDLVAEACRDESRDAVREGGNSFELAFETLGRIAMVELMNNRDVTRRIEGFAQYLDRQQFEFLD